MTHTLANGIRICTVDCPEGAFTFQLYGATSVDELRFLTSPSPGKFKQHKTLISPGNWTLLGRFEEITEETWNGVGLDTEAARSLIPGNPVVLIDKK